MQMDPFLFLILGVTFMITGTLWCLVLAYSIVLQDITFFKGKKILLYLRGINPYIVYNIV